MIRQYTAEQIVEEIMLTFPESSRGQILSIADKAIVELHSKYRLGQDELFLSTTAGKQWYPLEDYAWGKIETVRYLNSQGDYTLIPRINSPNTIATKSPV